MRSPVWGQPSYLLQLRPVYVLPFPASSPPPPSGQEFGHEDTSQPCHHHPCTEKQENYPKIQSRHCPEQATPPTGRSQSVKPRTGHRVQAQSQPGHWPLPAPCAPARIKVSRHSSVGAETPPPPALGHRCSWLSGLQDRLGMGLTRPAFLVLQPADGRSRGFSASMITRLGYHG